MRLEEFLKFLAESLDDLGIPYMLTGSLAASYHGSVRATQDIDLVVDSDVESLAELGSRLRTHGFYASDDAIREAVRMRGQFNAVDPASGWKADFILRKDRPFSIAEFEDRIPLVLPELALAVARPEDLIVAKLEWSKLGDSERQLRDVAAIVAIQGDALDIPRIERWVAELGVESQWARAKSDEFRWEST